MKNYLTFTGIAMACLLLVSTGIKSQTAPKDQEYIIISWNDLGMHCANKDFQRLVVLPPYNNIEAQVIKKGNATTLPEIITTGSYVTYEIPGNTYSVGKTNFWSYEDQIFGVSLPDNTGLTGAGLSGQMEVGTDHFYKEGIPLTPYTDANLVTEDPYQLGLIKLFDNNNILIASTQPVIPVSNEINCVSSGCHSSETNILYQHENEGGFNPNNTPILCAQCHSSNALGLPGTPGLASLSEVIHDQHKGITNNCYKCHPGPNTQCQRDVMHAAGMVCQDCHGSVGNVAQTIKNGRQPWFQEPSCGATNCHGPNYAEEPGKLFRQSKGHGGLYCSTCHGSPHAILPSENDRDNVQNIALQGFAGTLQRCELCHGTMPTAPGPHGILPPSTLTKTNLKIYLEGPYNGTEMDTYLNAGTQLPLNQPYNVSPWFYSGTESVNAIPGTNVVDWVLVELRETNGTASTATSDKIISQRAGFLLNNGSIVDIDGISPLEFSTPVYTNIYAVVRHRNHLAVMTSSALEKISDSYTFDFTTGFDKVFGGSTGYKQIAAGIFGMVGGDGDADGIVEVSDKDLVWNSETGHSGYLSGDYDMNAQVENKDKNDIWLPNNGLGQQLPVNANLKFYSSTIPQ